MGDRASVFIREQSDQGVYLYTHWGGYELPKDVHKALSRQQRWTDAPYLARIVFHEMGGGTDKETGFGISTEMCDNEHLIIHLDCAEQRIGLSPEGETPNHWWTFDRFVSDPSDLYKAFEKE